MAVFPILNADPKQRCQEQSRTRAAFYLLFVFKGLKLNRGKVMALLFHG
jgi:hypothetical protein